MFMLDLTLTRVVFELNISPYVGKIPINLTLTRVVFELKHQIKELQVL